MKIKNKGKVHPSPSSSSTTTTTTTTTTTSSCDPIFTALQLLPAAVLALAAVLTPPDLEVLSYLLAARSLHPSSSPSNRKSSSAASASSSAAHRSPSFHCDCFHCYTIYWLRWDSSPNRDLIHRVIDAFEDHLSSSSSNSPSTVPLFGKSKVGGGRGGGRRGKDKAVNHEKRNRTDSSLRESGGNGGAFDVGDTTVLQEKKGGEEDDSSAMEDSLPGSPPPPSPPLPGLGGARGDHKGLARKVLPDVLGILNSRLWNLWSPNV